MQEAWQRLPYQGALCNVDLTKAMYLDRLRLHAGLGANDRLEAFAGQDTVPPYLDRSDGYGVVGMHIQPRCFAIDRNNFVNGAALEHEPV
jgi:hypothetical protein